MKTMADCNRKLEELVGKLEVFCAKHGERKDKLSDEEASEGVALLTAISMVAWFTDCEDEMKPILTKLRLASALDKLK